MKPASVERNKPGSLRGLLTVAAVSLSIGLAITPFHIQRPVWQVFLPAFMFIFAMGLFARKKGPPWLFKAVAILLIALPFLSTAIAESMLGVGGWD